MNDRLLSASFASLLLVALGTVAACSSFGGADEPANGDTPTPDQDGGDKDGSSDPVKGGGTHQIALMIDAVDPRTFVQNKDNEVSFHLTRVGDATSSSIVITATDLPADTTAAPVMLSAGTNDGKLLIHPALTAPQGTFTFTVKADAGTKDGASATAPVTAFLRGAVGALDTTFGTAGSLTGGGRFVLDPTDRIYAFGTKVNRFDKDGKAAPTALTEVLPGATGVFMQPTSFYACAGTNNNTFGFHHYGLDGADDQGFGDHNFVSADYGGQIEDDAVDTCGVSPSGQLAVFVESLGAPSFEFFSAAGTQVNAYSSSDSLSASLYTASGIVGARNLNAGGDRVLIRNTTTGPDSTFGGAGKVTMTGASQDLTQIVEDSAQRLITVGTNFLGRVSKAGARDGGFANAPLPVTGTTTGEAHIAIQKDGKIVRAQTIDGKCVVLRYNGTDGSLDTTFGTNGHTTLPDAGCAVTAVGIFSDGRILVGDSTLYRVWAD